MSRRNLNRVVIATRSQEETQSNMNETLDRQNLSASRIHYTQATTQADPNSQSANHVSPSNTHCTYTPTNDHYNFGEAADTNLNGSDYSQQRKVRGPTLLADIWNLPEGERILVQFNNRGQPIKKEGRVLASFLGTIAKNPLIAPLHISDWRSFPKRDKDMLLILVQKKFVIPKRGEKWVLKSLGRKWKDFKGDIKSENFEKYRNMDEAINNKPDRIPRDQWTILVSYWFSEKAKKRCDTNRRSRSMQKMPHTGGSKSIARLMDEMAENGQEPSRAKVYIETHKRRKDGRPIDVESSERIEKITEMLDQLPNSTEQSFSNGSWKDDIYSKVMGPEVYGRVRGLGLGPTSLDLSGSSHHPEVHLENNTLADERVQHLKAELKEIEQRHANEISEMRGNQARLENQLSMVLSSMGIRFPTHPMTFGSNETFNGQMPNSFCSHQPDHMPNA